MRYLTRGRAARWASATCRRSAWCTTATPGTWTPGATRARSCCALRWTPSRRRSCWRPRARTSRCARCRPRWTPATASTPAAAALGDAALRGAGRAVGQPRAVAPGAAGPLAADGRFELKLPYVDESELAMDVLRQGRNVRDALMEDIGRGDWTASWCPPAAACGPRGGQASRRDLRPALVRRLRAGAGPEAAVLSWAVAEGQAMAARHGGVPHPGRRPRPAQRRAAGAELPADAVGGGHRDTEYVHAIAGLSPNPRGCVVLDTRKTLPGPAPGAEVRGAHGRRAEPAHGAVGRHPDQGKPHRRRRWHHARAAGRALR
jgi:hypothetical protein